LSDESIFPRERVTILGVLNVTPDSFSDGGRFTGSGVSSNPIPSRPVGRVDVDAVLRAGADLLSGGAHVLDVGGESTRPGAIDVSAEEENERVVPVVRALVEHLGATVSVDTRKAAVAREAIAAGARVVNDVSGLAYDCEVASAVAAARGVVLILGHMRGTPADMQRAPRYQDVLSEVASELEASLARARSLGVSDDCLVVDPGIGFGKRLQDNLQLIAHAGWLRERLGSPVLVGPSRKSFLGEITGDGVERRDAATQAACAVAAFAGADAVRVHTAPDAVRAVAVGRALREARRKELS
jgi:dihydropteroate synthase